MKYQEKDIRKYLTEATRPSWSYPGREHIEELTIYPIDKTKLHVRVKLDVEFPVKFSDLKWFSNYFGTDDIDVDHEYQSGCETCDYGASHTHTFILSNVSKNMPD